jgi:hypothetical protein
VGVGRQANLPKKGKRWIPELISGTEGRIQNWIAPPCWRKSWLIRAAAEEQQSCCLVKTTVLTTLHKLAVLPHLTIPTNLVDRRTKYHSQASHWWDHIRASSYMSIPGLDT